QCKMYLGHVKVLLGMFLSLKTLYRKRTVIWPFYFYTIIRTLSILVDIIIPQALRNSIPNLTTQVIELIKDTSLAFTIGIIDMMGQVKLIIGNNYGLGMLEVYVVISIIYWIIALIIQTIFALINKRAQKPYRV
ncbi:ABC transporter permease subunit, partial [Staphylococcus ureilyticus]|uniref:ABC transporter permease subunit n=3 Tax=Staphylococcus ureilyticus TaxID=94138 RepID=UPI00321BC6D6